jgi:hypothetical protein
MVWSLRRPVFFLRCLLPVLLCGLIIGCGSGVRVSGKVTFKGQPVPGGKVYISPDTSKGNSGPTGYADIKNGFYDTGAAGGSPCVAGAVVFGVEGVDPNAPPDKAAPDVTTKLLFPRYEFKMELPGSSTTKDIDVPAEAAKGPPQGKKDGGPIVP